MCTIIPLVKNMKCEVCKRGVASLYRYVAVFGRQVPICTACFQNLTATQKNSFAKKHSGVALDGLLKAMMNFQTIDEVLYEGDGKGRGVVCSNCGFEFEEYFQKGRLGCVKCYDVFHPQVKSVVYKIHGCVRHNGSRPT